MEQAIAPPAAAQPSGDLGFFARWANIYFSPKKTFEAMRLKTRWVTPFVLLLVLGTGFGLLTTPARTNDTLEQMKKRFAESSLPADRQAEILETVENRAGNPVWNAFVPVVMTIIYLIAAGILFFIGNILMGGEARFVSVFSTLIYANLIGVPELLVKGFLAYVKGTLNTPLSIAAFFSPDKSETFAYRFINGFDIFSIWFIAVLIIGLATAYGFKTGKMAAWILPLWVLMKVVGAVLAGMGMMFGG